MRNVLTWVITILILFVGFIVISAVLNLLIKLVFLAVLVILAAYLIQKAIFR